MASAKHRVQARRSTDGFAAEHVTQSVSIEHTKLLNTVHLQKLLTRDWGRSGCEFFLHCFDLYYTSLPSFLYLTTHRLSPWLWLAVELEAQADHDDKPWPLPSSLPLLVGVVALRPKQAAVTLKIPMEIYTPPKPAWQGPWVKTSTSVSDCTPWSVLTGSGPLTTEPVTAQYSWHSSCRY